MTSQFLLHILGQEIDLIFYIGPIYSIRVIAGISLCFRVLQQCQQSQCKSRAENTGI